MNEDLHHRFQIERSTAEYTGPDLPNRISSFCILISLVPMVIPFLGKWFPSSALSLSEIQPQYVRGRRGESRGGEEKTCVRMSSTPHESLQNLLCSNDLRFASQTKRHCPSLSLLYTNGRVFCLCRCLSITSRARTVKVFTLPATPHRLTTSF
jgi:hypothetical protein